MQVEYVEGYVCRRFSVPISRPLCRCTLVGGDNVLHISANPKIYEFASSSRAVILILAAECFPAMEGVLDVCVPELIKILMPSNMVQFGLTALVFHTGPAWVHCCRVALAVELVLIHLRSVQLPTFCAHPAARSGLADGSGICR